MGSGRRRRPEAGCHGGCTGGLGRLRCRIALRTVLPAPPNPAIARAGPRRARPARDHEATSCQHMHGRCAAVARHRVVHVEEIAARRSAQISEGHAPGRGAPAAPYMTSPGQQRGCPSKTADERQRKRHVGFSHWLRNPWRTAANHRSLRGCCDWPTRRRLCRAGIDSPGCAVGPADGSRPSPLSPSRRDLRTSPAAPGRARSGGDRDGRCRLGRVLRR
jgi:hypothetical protein